MRQRDSLAPELANGEERRGNGGGGDGRGGVKRAREGRGGEERGGEGRGKERRRGEGRGGEGRVSRSFYHPTVSRYWIVHLMYNVHVQCTCTAAHICMAHTHLLMYSVHVHEKSLII